MEVIAISQFKATCLAVLERVRKTGEPVIVTRRGKPVAQIQPPPPPEVKKESRFGCMRGTIETPIHVNREARPAAATRR